MGKVSPKEKESKTPRQRRRPRNSNNKYLRPGALAQLRYSKASSTKSCTDLGKKRIALSDSKKVDNNDNESVIAQRPVPIHETPLMSPERFGFPTAVSPFDLVRQNSLLKTPQTPRFEDSDSESRLESLPMDLLVKVLCHLHHDQLKAVFHVSQRIRMAVTLARQFHFNYTTPDRSRQEMLSTMTPLATEHWPFFSKGEGRGLRLASPHTPKAPRHGPRPPSRLKYTEMRQVAAALFQEASLPSRCMVPSVMSKPLCKNRVLFYEDELCQAVAQNKLR
ncbi:F-box protein At4g35930-like isoform X1 [Chenopodium quinoa]|uniref:F-box domain-containing protein n=1 Tax=Chenopodium quinoa TaxID=63459 RepID=A0A803KWC4_CHEQI|nr:F-box protein At4g35930-like isoform X1 [Chenopodium quinoa]